MADRTSGWLGGLLGACLALGGCTGQSAAVAPTATPSPAPPGATALPQAGPSGPQRVALLVPQTGALAPAADVLVKAAQLALAVAGAPTLDIRDTGGTPQGAAVAVRAALAAGDTLILGPLTGPETASIAPITRAAGVPVLAFTSDTSQAGPGIWVLGLTPAEQVSRLVDQLRQSGQTRIAALLPRSELGSAMGTALEDAARQAALPAPDLQTYADGMPALTEAVQAIAAYDTRRGPLDLAIRHAREAGDRAALKAARDATRQPLPPLPYDALLLADTATPLAELATLLPFYDVTGVRILGPALWAQAPNRAGADAITKGAWYAAFDPAARQTFATAYQSRYGVAAPMLADFAFDAAAIARVTLTDPDHALGASLLRPGGFVGADGPVRLLEGGVTLRALAVFQIDPAGPSLIGAAPSDLSAAQTPSS